MKNKKKVFNKKAMVITIAILLAVLAMGSASAASRYTKPSFARPGIAPGEYNPGMWGNPRIVQLKKMIARNNTRINQLNRTIETTKMEPQGLRTTKKEIKQLKKDNREYQKELDNLLDKKSTDHYRTPHRRTID